MTSALKPPFKEKTARMKVQAAEDAWNTRRPDKVVLAYTEDSDWRNRDLFFTGREAIRQFLSRKWQTELHYQLRKELWAWTDERISVRFEYEYQHAVSGQWFRAHGNEHWEFNTQGLIQSRDMSANDIPISSSDRRIHRHNA